MWGPSGYRMMMCNPLKSMVKNQLRRYKSNKPWTDFHLFHRIIWITWVCLKIAGETPQSTGSWPSNPSSLMATCRYRQFSNTPMSSYETNCYTSIVWFWPARNCPPLGQGERPAGTPPRCWSLQPKNARGQLWPAEISVPVAWWQARDLQKTTQISRVWGSRRKMITSRWKRAPRESKSRLVKC